MNARNSFSIIGLIAMALVITPSQTQAQAPATPTEEHKVLAQLEGTWNAKVKMGEEVSSGTMTYSMECGGLWLIGDYRGEMGGMKFQGRGMDGYDPDKKKYVSVWVDSMSTRPGLFEGTYDKEKKLLTMLGEGPGPDGRPAKYKMTTHKPGRDHMTFTMYFIAPDGTETPMMSIEYTRKK